MRVISQDGTIDVPYEISSFSMAVGKYKDVEHAAVYCHNSSTAVGTKMAEYNSKEKAEKAMEELQYAYACHNTVLLDKGKSNDIPNDKMMKAVIGGVFQFQTEEELE
jgi:hypothetical protein|nr:MAG TPA: hypothetical protein [Bacteriophage sp.]